MKVSISRALRTEKPAADTGHCPIQIVVTARGQRIRFAPGLTCHPDSWDKETKMLKPRAPYAKETKDKLKLWQELIEEKADQLPDDAPLAELTSAVLARMQPQKLERREPPTPTLLAPNTPLPPAAGPPPATATDLMGLWAEWIEACRSRVSGVTGELLDAKTIAAYEGTGRRIEMWAKDHREPLTLATVCSTSFYESFRAWCLRQRDNRPNTFARYIKQFKSFMKWCESQDDPARWPPSPKWRQFEAKERYVGVDSLDIEEVMALQALDFRSPEMRAAVAEHLAKVGAKPGTGQRRTHLDDTLVSLEEARDTFLMACYTGLRISDLYTLSASHLRGAVIQIEAGKNKIKCVIPFFDDQLFRPGEIVKRYLDRNPHGPILPQRAEYTINKRLLVVGQLAGISRFPLTTKYGRKTFVTISVYKEIPVRVIMQATGHQTEASFNRYLGVNIHELVKAFRKRARPIS